MTAAITIYPYTFHSRIFHPFLHLSPALKRFAFTVRNIEYEITGERVRAFTCCLFTSFLVDQLHYLLVGRLSGLNRRFITVFSTGSTVRTAEAKAGSVEETLIETFQQPVCFFL